MKKKQHRLSTDSVQYCFLPFKNILKLSLLITMLAFVSTCYAQYQYIDMNRFFVKKIWKAYVRKDKLNFLTTNSDTSITFSIRDTTVRNLDMVVYFEKGGKAYKVEEIYDCDSCFQVVFNKVLKDSRFQWKKIKEGVYLSQYAKKLLLYKNPKHGFAYILQHNKYMTKEEYDSLLPKQNNNVN